MKCKVFSEWISPEAVTNGQVTEKASNSRMSILELSGEHVFLLGACRRNRVKLLCCSWRGD